MGKLITVVGNTGVGKTTFVQQLCQVAPLVRCIEQLEERPYQELFSQDRQKYAFANQIDFMLYRADQEIKIRSSELAGVQDGGLDEDFFIFSRLFYQKGYLNKGEFDLCERNYYLLREILAPPDLIVWLKAPLDVIAGRFAQRDRRLGIAEIEDMGAMEVLLEDWLNNLSASSLITVDVGSEDRSYSKTIDDLLALIAE